MSFDPFAVAVDPEIIPPGCMITILKLPPPWNNKSYIATDIGISIEGKHIDICIGESKRSDEETYRIAIENNSICILF